MALPDADWVFAYGSLIWSPEFDHDRAEPARLHGYHRAFCIASRHYRGTPESPGVVLGLDRGGSCRGVAFHLRATGRAHSLRRLYAREMLGGVYRPVLASLTLRDDRRVTALAFVADPASPDYLRANPAEVLRRLTHCAGSRGPNRDYALQTRQALETHGIHDRNLAMLCRALEHTDGCGATRPGRRIVP